MFENIIGQGAAVQLGEDMESKRLAPSMLFFGPPASGKGSAGLELARALSCESPGAPWNCSCPACARHRYLIHPDLLILGPRSFSAEIAAAGAAFLREPEAPSTPVLFLRALRKLLARFSPVLWEDDPKMGKLSPLLQSLEEDLDVFETRMRGGLFGDDIEKLCDSIRNGAAKLEAEGIGENIPIAQIRRAAYWSRLAPAGKQKMLLIENADRMQEGSRNSLLKILEEPPETLRIVLTAPRREAIMPTLLSRLRPYRFLKRDEDREREVIRRVFRDPEAGRPASGTDAEASLEAGPENSGLSAGAGLISAYLDSFLAQSNETLRPMAAFFISAIARSVVLSLKKRGVADIPAPLLALGKYCASIAESAGLERVLSARDEIGAVLGGTGNFEGRSFSAFLAAALALVSEALRGEIANPSFIIYNEIWKKHSAKAGTAWTLWNQNPALTLEELFYNLKGDLAETI
jgi:DNA polymerase-3 subunit gamma/tau